MSYRAWVYIYTVLLLGVLASGLALRGLPQALGSWMVFAVLTGLATIVQLYKVLATPGKHQSYSATIVFFFAGALLLPPSLFVLLVLISRLVEWVRERLARSLELPGWYIQPFNIATHLLAGFAARGVYFGVSGDALTFESPLAVVAALSASAVYVSLNHALVARALVLARGISLRESGLLGLESLLPDFNNLCLGAIVAVLWGVNPWLIVLIFAPLVLIYRALMVPELKQEARTDAKTGLWNARHFNALFADELERAKRFHRPLALIMADLDLLRNVNNTYGHLAGDAVLAGIGRVMRGCVRDFDISARFGGEEFAIVLPETAPDEARAVAERIRAAIETTPYAIPGRATPIHATMSFGVACYPANAETASALIHEADVAVYQAKHSGRNRVVCAWELSPANQQGQGPVGTRPEGEYAAAFLTRQ
ncbi:MAG TPA: GGDEF domain-containing protein [Ardenticatenaceae bacterium]|nr:GGDEF domain-containing protein [Ardenticatenaceae bacterium]